MPIHFKDLNYCPSDKARVTYLNFRLKDIHNYMPSEFTKILKPDATQLCFQLRAEFRQTHLGRVFKVAHDRGAVICRPPDWKRLKTTATVGRFGQKEPKRGWSLSNKSTLIYFEEGKSFNRTAALSTISIRADVTPVPEDLQKLFQAVSGFSQATYYPSTVTKVVVPMSVRACKSWKV